MDPARTEAVNAPPIANDQTARANRKQRYSIWVLRHLLGGSSAEAIIRALGFSQIRSFYYSALERRAYLWAEGKRTPKDSVTYYEFGVGWGGSLSRYLEALAAFSKDSRHDFLGGSKTVLFDSFEGLPPTSRIEDVNPHWTEGKFAHGVDEIKRTIKMNCHVDIDSHSDNYRFVKGFYEVTLTPELRDELRNTGPDIITIDCDYYTSTKTALDWLRPLLSPGCLFYFDDVWAYDGDPRRGELRAINEFNAHGKGVLTPLPLNPYLAGQVYIYSSSEST